MKCRSQNKWHGLNKSSCLTSNIRQADDGTRKNVNVQAKHESIEILPTQRNLSIHGTESTICCDDLSRPML